MYTEEHLYSIALRRCKLIGDIHFNQLVSNIGSAKEVWEQAKRKFRDFEQLKGKKLSDIGNKDHLLFAEKELKFCEENQIKILLRTSENYPFLLEQCEDAPAILYQKGDFPKVGKHIAMVGTRKMTHYGKEFISDFFREVNPKSIISVSGLALGTDTEVHRQSIANKVPTIAVLAHGFHMLYPARNRILAQEIIEKGGCLLTEFNSSHKPDKEHFIQRNRVIAGLSTATIVVETAYKGGSISTATFANNYSRDVFALSGKIMDKFSQGCNKLIFDNKAQIIINIQQLLKEISLDSESKAQIGDLFAPEKTTEVPSNLKPIFEIIFKNPKISLDEIIIKTDLPSQEVSGVLLELELLGYIKMLSGKQFTV